MRRRRRTPDQRRHRLTIPSRAVRVRQICSHQLLQLTEARAALLLLCRRHKLLLGERDGYQSNMVARHLALHEQHPLQLDDFERWLELFRETVNADFTGPSADRAKTLATRIAGNLVRLTRSPIST